eukprot:gnl/TRDRNA2_/TRDRNA2_187607_c0_seq1.p1 gnl/TRDRNA2_/TRDRNA2_187607_c0~~gnl/TRDRNA2_/TRDRNA2_187607_c0_seq1.p1  ORF type:complete len:999 (+),score=192.06 gnl/TRDRNA2_/TRDRNA2_187607_c0_seq1:194-2998(+)
MEQLRKGEHKAAFEQFKYAEAILIANQQENDNKSLLSVTCNNLGCYYKKVGKFHGALSYLRRALKMEVELNTDEMTLAGTHLNLCAILSKLEKNQKAVQHALCALELISRKVTAPDAKVTQDDYSVLAIAYHNIAMEREFLQQWDQAATAFQTGYQVAKKFLGDNHPLTLTLGRNCDAVLQKAKMTKPDKTDTKPRMSTADGKDNTLEAQAQSDIQNIPKLPAIGRPIDPSQSDDNFMVPGGMRNSVRSEAADWAKSEEAMWASFAQKTMRGEPGVREDTPEGMMEMIGARRSILSPDIISAAQTPDVAREPPRLPPPGTLVSLREMQDLTLVMPKAADMGDYRLAAAPPERFTLKRTPFTEALDNHPEALMEIIDNVGDGKLSIRSSPNDFRPNRSMGRSTRTSRVVRRTGVFNSTMHRDRVETELARKRAVKTQPWKSAQVQKLAAERIQRVWRCWYQYCQDNVEWMTMTWICATTIQAHWRSYHVRRQRLDKYAKVIQRHCRGFLVRCVLKSHTAAVTIQRRVVGMLTRKQLLRRHEAARQIQRLVRGGLTRRRVNLLRNTLVGTTLIIQRHIRVWLAKKVAFQLAEEKRYSHLMEKACIDLQRFFRGWKGRQRADAAREEYQSIHQQHAAAVMIQSMVRKNQASRRVDRMREIRLRQMETAATLLRKMWLGTQTRRDYLRLKADFRRAEGFIITIQRFGRGFLTRLRLWKEAIRAEEELWAVLEIQRVWRGYQGRVKFEGQLEKVWRRELCAAVLQRNIRGWMARVRVNRMKRQLARAEFERARRRFRAAQKIQALARGVHSRKVTGKRKAMAVRAATEIQRMQRGSAIRKRLWLQVAELRATSIQAVARGFLVRNRRYHMIARVILIQRAYRRWLRKPIEFREKRLEKTRHRKRQASIIQAKYRSWIEKKNVERISKRIKEQHRGAIER